MAYLDETGLAALWQDVETVVGKLTGESDGTVRGGIAELTANGHAEQVSTTGKNLLPNTASKITLNGASFERFSNGMIRVSGTVSETTEAAIGYGVYGSNNNLVLTPGSTYIISDNRSNSTTAYLRIMFFDSSGAYIDSSVYNTENGSATFTVPINASGMQVWTHAEQGAASVDFYPQIELGSTATEYEPYTGGAPSPSPEFPQTIEVVRGRNLANPSEFETGYVDGDGTIHQSALFKHTGYIKVDAGKTYVASQGTAFSGGVFLVVYDASKQYVTRYSMNAATNVVAAIPSNGAYVRSSMNASNENTFQLTLGSTPQPYVPYGHVGMEVRVFDSAYTSLEQGAYSNADGSKVDNAARVRSVGKLPVHNGAHTIYFKNSNYQANIHGWYGDGTFYGVLYSFGSAATTFDVPEGVSAITIAIRNTSNTAITPQQVSESGMYTIEYTTPIPLPQRGWVAGLPDGTADTLTLDGAGKCEWELADAVVKVPELAFTYDSGDKRFYVNAATLGIRGLQTTRLTPILSEPFVSKWHGETYDRSWDGVTYLSGGNLFVFAKAYDNVTDFTSAFANTSFYYPLATPVTEDCGYVEDWPTDIPEGATVTISELDSVGIKYFVDSAVTELARQWYARANSEYADRLTALEQAVAELATS